MQAAAVTAGRAIRRRCAIAGSLISLVAGLCAIVPAPQAALAASQGATSISAGGDYSCLLASGKAYCWGYNGYGQLGDAEKPADSSVPVAVSTRGALAGKALTQISAGYTTECALDSTGAAYCWGLNNGGLGGSSSGSGVPLAVSTSGALAGKTLTQISAGLSRTCALDNTGAAYCWGGTPVAVDTSGALAGKTLTQISAAGDDTCALDAAGAAYCWGNNNSGQLGDGRTTSSNVPVAVDTSGALAGKTLTQITASTGYTCALDSAGAAYCWGRNTFGQLGDGRTTSSNVPVAVDTSGALAGKTLTQVSADMIQTCALDAAGAAYCWGDNASGQLGDGRTTSSNVPVAVDTSGALAGKTLTQVSAAPFSACALDSTGAAYCWGDNSAGELGDDSAAIQSNVPVLVAPQAPANVTADPGNTIATVSWTAPAFLNTGALTGYTATASPGGAMCTTPTGTTACTITGLANGTKYHITVAAHTTVGGSGASTPAIVTPEPGVGTGPIASGYHQTKCIDDSNDSSVNDTPVVIGECNGSPEQNWTIKADGTIHINGKCMNIYRDEKSNKAPVELWTCTGGASQQWQWTGGTLVNANSGKCLDDPRFNTADGTQLEIYTCNGGVNQQWQLP